MKTIVRWIRRQWTLFVDYWRLLADYYLYDR